LSAGTFGLAGFTADSIDLEGSTATLFDGSGSSYTFDVASSPSAPEPGSVLLALTGLAGVLIFGRRRMSAAKN